MLGPVGLVLGACLLSGCAAGPTSVPARARTAQPGVPAPSSAGDAGYVPTATHRAPGVPPRVTAAGVPAALVRQEWSAEDAGAPEPSAVQWPVAPSLDRLTISAATAPAAATVNAFRSVDGAGVPSEQDMLTLNCSSTTTASPGPTCSVVPAGSGSVAVALTLPPGFRYCVLWAQWWALPPGSTTPAPQDVRQVSASWALSTT